MACNKPFLRFLSARHNPLGYDCAIPTPCGHCSGCLRDYITSWSDRCTFETMTQRRPSSLVTLTYNDEHLPSGRSVSQEDCVKFNKRLRYYLDYYFFPSLIKNTDAAPRTSKTPATTSIPACTCAHIYLRSNPPHKAAIICGRQIVQLKRPK